MKEMIIGGRHFVWGSRTYIMGILNVTPDSFSDGGRFAGENAAIAHALEMEAEGADIIDVGGESTRPGAAALTAEAEIERVLPVITQVAQKCAVPVSIDTYHAKTALEALKAGAHLVNDIKGLEGEPEIAEIAATYGAAVCIMHSKTCEGISGPDVTEAVMRDLESAVASAVKRGVGEDRIIIDPGIGFGKNYEQNVVLLQELSRFKTLGFPLLLGVSRKSVIGLTLSAPPDKRLEGTIAANVLGIAHGADIIRVHDVAGHKAAALMADKLVRF